MPSIKLTGALLSLPIAAMLLAGCSSPTDTVAAGDAESSSSTAASAAPAAKTVSWFAKTYPTFTTKTFTGKGDDVLTLPKGATKGLIKAKHTGSANFIVSTLDSDNQPTADMGINEIGHFHGTVAYGLQSLGNPAKTLKVQADGKWTITISDLDTAKALPSSGAGDGVFKYNGKAETAKITHDGTANFVVEEYSDAPISNLEINEIGKYSGKSIVDPGPAIISVEADGNWTFK